ncbi:MAG TPA: hypothetical protein VK968_13875 [Roseimicrobium sp.]|nr:hypothetical protein [Roseimicrobium sp.]
MKTLITLLLVAGIASGATWFLVSRKQAAVAERERTELATKWTKEKEALEREIKRLANKAPRVEVVTKSVPVDGRVTPAEIINQLVAIQPGEGADRSSRLREIIHLLESLREHGDNGVPAIRDFLARNEDIPYETASAANDDPRARFGNPGGDRNAPNGPTRTRRNTP